MEFYRNSSILWIFEILEHQKFRIFEFWPQIRIQQCIKFQISKFISIKHVNELFEFLVVVLNFSKFWITYYNSELELLFNSDCEFAFRNLKKFKYQNLYKSSAVDKLFEFCVPVLNFPKFWIAILQRELEFLNFDRKFTFRNSYKSSTSKSFLNFLSPFWIFQNFGSTYCKSDFEFFNFDPKFAFSNS